VNIDADGEDEFFDPSCAFLSLKMLQEFHAILIHQQESVKVAMQQLDQTSEKILFVTDGDDRLIGSLTDGDIRRWILAGGGLDEAVEQVCFKGTLYAGQNYDVEELKSEMVAKKIVYVPVLDQDRRIVEFLIWDQLFDTKVTKKVKYPLSLPVVIMAGGQGTRLNPFTTILPKPLIPIGDKSILEWIIDKFLPYEVEHFYITVNHKAKIIKSYFEELAPPYGITYIYEEKPLGTAGSLKALEGNITGSFLMTNCDILIDLDYNDFVSYHEKNNHEISLVASVKSYHIPYGICELNNDGTLKQINEKPEYHYLVNTGMYVMKADTLRYIPQNEFFHITELIEKVIAVGGKVGVYPISETAWVDVGEWAEYRKASERLTL